MKNLKPLLMSQLVYSAGMASLAIVLAHRQELGSRALVCGLCAGLINAAMDLVPWLRESDGDLFSWRYVTSSVIGGAIALVLVGIVLHAKPFQLLDSLFVLTLAIVVRPLARLCYARKTKRTIGNSI